VVMSSSEEKLIVADISDAFYRVKKRNGYLFPKPLSITPYSVLNEMSRKGITSWDQIHRFGTQNKEGLSRVTLLVCDQLKREIEDQM